MAKQGIYLCRFLFYDICTIGEVPEWTIGTVSKTVVLLAGTVGSNPTLSVTKKPLMITISGFLIHIRCTSDTHWCMDILLRAYSNVGLRSRYLR